MVAKLESANTPAPCSSRRFTAEVDQINEAEWNSLLRGFADATIYQTWAYGAVCWGERQLSHFVLRQDGALVALAQLRIVRVPVLGAGVAYLRWGPLCTHWDPEILRAVTEALIDEYVVRRGLVLRVVPNVFQQDSPAAAITGMWNEMGFREETAVRRYQTMRVSLKPPLETLRGQLSARWRRQLNIAERNDLVITEGQTDGLYEQFLALYHQMMARKQFETSVDVNDFQRIQRRLPECQKMTTFICAAGGRPVAGLVVDRIGQTAIYLLAATGGEGLQARGSYLLQWHAMQRLKEQGCDWYDLGGINPAVNPGVFTFKSGMGGVEVSQLGRYCLGGSALSRLSVSAGERINRVGRRLLPRR